MINNNNNNNISLNRQEFFIQRSKEKFGDKFDYSLLHYEDSKTPVNLICREHEKSFFIRPLEHLNLNTTDKDHIKRLSSSVNSIYSEESLINKFEEKYKNTHCNFNKLHYINLLGDHPWKKVKFYCEIHGEVEEFVTIQKKEDINECCPLCRKEKSLNRIKSLKSRDKFLKTVKEKFGNSLDFSGTQWINYRTPVTFKCEKHGEQKALPSRILKSKYGCPACVREALTKSQSLTTEEFIERAKEIHKDKYDYSKVNYINSKTKVEIICPEHGSFWQLPYGHLKGQGCGKCKAAPPLKESEAIENSKNLCGDKIDFSNAKYERRATPLEVFCKEHRHTFKRSYSMFMEGHTECPYCSGQRIETEDYKDFLKNYFGDRYDYSKVEYKNRLEPVEIICLEHGSFFKSPASILSFMRSHYSVLCPVCSMSEGEYKIKEFLEENNINYINQKKFKECVHQKELPFDFYLPDYNICIEYQGEQHYHPVEYWGGEDSFKELQNRDNIKRNFCKGYKISLLEIIYTIPIKELPFRLKEFFENMNLKDNLYYGVLE